MDNNIHLEIKNPVLFAITNNYEAKTPHIRYVLDTLNLKYKRFDPCTEWGEYDKDDWDAMKDLRITINPFRIVWEWFNIDEERTYVTGLDYDACGVTEIQNEDFLEDEEMDIIREDAKGLDIAIEIANL